MADEEKKDRFRLLREGSEEEAREVFDDMIKNATRAAIPAIMTRNLSHNAGKNIKKIIKKKKRKK